MNIKLFKQTTLEDYKRRLEKVIEKIAHVESQPDGLFKRIMNFDRQDLYDCMHKVLNTSQCSVIYNRDELSFLESLCHLISYNIYDDGELMIKWNKYNLNKGVMENCDSKTKGAKPYLDYYDGKSNEIAREKEIHWLLDWVEADRLKMRKLYKSIGDKEKYKKEWINYN